MPRNLCTLALALVLAGAAFAQDPFEGLNTGTVALTQPSAPAGAQGAPGPAAPFWGGNPYEYGVWNPGHHHQYQNLKWRYDRVRSQIRQLRNWYRRGTYERQVYDRHLDYGEDLWKRYRKWMDPGSAWQLEGWVGEWERYLASSGYGHGSGGWYTGHGGWYGNGGYHGGGYRYPDYGYYDSYDRLYYGGTYGYMDHSYLHGFQLGHNIGHIVHGSRSRNDLELIGGILGTAGSTISIINDARGW